MSPSQGRGSMLERDRERAREQGTNNSSHSITSSHVIESRVRSYSSSNGSSRSSNAQTMATPLLAVAGGQVRTDRWMIGRTDGRRNCIQHLSVQGTEAALGSPPVPGIN
jgi:hypothetical protein